jgi:hypothetical protein
MFEAFFKAYPDREIVSRPDAALLEQYEGVLPASILQLWRDYGFGLFMDGYLRLVNPNDWQHFVNCNVQKSNFNYIPIAVSAFGDVFVWKTKGDGYIEFYNFRHSTFTTLSTHSGIDILFDIKFVDQDYIWSKLNCPDYIAIKTRLGVPAYGQCYGYVPLLALGGSERIEQLQLVDAQVHMELMAQVSGPL